MSDRPNSPPFPHSLEFINCAPSSPISYGETFIVKQEVDEESFIPNQEEDIKFEPDPLCIEPSISNTEETFIKTKDGIITLDQPKPCYETVIYNVQIDYETKNGVTIYICPHCKKRDMNKFNLLNHIIQLHNKHQHRKQVCKICTRTFPTFEHLFEHLKLHKNIFICTVCNFYTKQRHYFRKHLKTHDLTLYNCKLCHKSCYTLKDLKYHEKEFHMEDDTLYCAHCKYSNTQKSLLKVHIIFQHFPKLIYRCSSCNNGYTSKSDFRKHKKDHENDQTNNIKKLRRQIYCCSYCLFASKSLTILQNHMKICDNKAFNKTNTNKCEKCGDVFENARELRTHTRDKHLQIKYFKCEHCTFFTLKRKLFDQHFTLNHMVGRPQYKCSLCPDFVTSLKRALVAHEKTHGPKKKRRYECSRCKFFTYKYVRFLPHLTKEKH